MYAAAGGASLAGRQARRNMKKQGSNDRTLRPPVTTLPPLVHPGRRQQPPPPHQHFLSVSDAASSTTNLQRQHSQVTLRRQPSAQKVQPAQEEAEEDRKYALEMSRPPSYAELNGRIASFGSADMSPEGKAAWQERDRERRVSLTDVAVNHRIKATEAHRRWMKRNRIHDSSFGGSSSDEDIPGGLYGHQSEAANALLYVGLGTVAIGLVISFVGTGEKGFKTLELRLIGPSLIGSGLLCCLVRIFLCVCPSRCLRRRHKHRHRHKNSASANHQHHGFFQRSNKETVRATEDIALADQTSLLMKNNKKSVSILTSPAAQPSGSSTNNHHHQNEAVTSPDKSIVATTTLFLQHERERASSAIGHQVPAINIPNFIGSNSDEEEGSHYRRQQFSEGNLLDLELQQLDASSFDICSFDSSNSQDKSVILNENDSEGSKTVKSASRREKMSKPRAPANSRVVSSASKSRIGLVNPDPDAHKLEEDMLLADEVAAEMDSHSLSKNSSCSKNGVPSMTRQVTTSSPQHSEKDDLLQNEIVLSPAKLQQDIKDQ